MSKALWAVCAALATFPLAVARTQARQPVAASSDSLLRSFLRGYLRDRRTGVDSTTGYTIGLMYPAAGRTSDVLVYVSGRTWCGTGGCLLLVLEPTASTYRVLGRTTITRPPIRVLPSTHHGYPDLSVWVAGGGVRHPYTALVTFDGVRYPSSPTIPPARRAPDSTAGQVVISGDEEGERLYPRSARSSAGYQPADVTSTGTRVVLPDSEVAYSPDSALVAFPRRTTPLVPGRPAYEDDDSRELWIARRDGTGARRLLAARPDSSLKRRLSRFMTPAFSLDGHRIFFLSMAWATSHALHVYDLTTGTEHFVRPAADFVIIPRGRFAGCLLVSDHTWNPRTKSYYYPRRVVTLDSGAEIAWVGDRGDDDPTDPAFVAWWRKNVSAAAAGSVRRDGKSGAAADPRCK